MIFLIFFPATIISRQIAWQIQEQISTSNYLKLIDFETYYIKSNTLLFFLPTKHAMVLQHGPFSLRTMLEGP